MGFFSFLLKSDSAKPEPVPLKVDMHSHFLPGIDDGAQNMEESLNLLKTFEDRGYEKIITTPHIIQDLYQNTPDSILPVLEKVKTALKETGSKLQIHAAAEYFIDDRFIEMLENGEFGWFFQKTSDSVALYLQQAENNPQSVETLKAKARNGITQKYNWDEVTRAYVTVFKALIRNGKSHT
jgi:hypothetical protein